MDPEVWNLLHDGVVVAVAREGAHARVTVSAPHLAAGFGGDSFDLVLAGTRRLAYRAYSDRWDEPWVEGDAIVAAAPSLVEAEVEGGELRVWCPSGVLSVEHDTLSIEVGGRPVTIEALRAAVAAYWAAWREQNDLSGLHPLVREALRGDGSATSMPRLLDAWRAARTSELADAVEALGRAADREVRPLTSPDDLAGWPAHFRRAPSAALDALVEAATATFGLLADDEPERGHPDLGSWLDARRALGARWWRALAAALSALRDEPPDPRIGRAVICMLRSPSDHWFVDHPAEAAVPTTPGTSFADHALALMEVHADAGTAARLDESAVAIAIEADCNGAEMVERLRALATTLRVRFPDDRTLPDAARTALRHRAPV